MQITTLAVDLAKNCFQLHGVNSQGGVVLRKKLNRQEFKEFMAQIPSCRVFMESCGSSNYWGRKFSAQGHQVRLIAAYRVRAYKKSKQKNDRNDAQAILDAGLRPHMNFVGVKNLYQQDLQSHHRAIEQLKRIRTAMINQCRGLLAEYGVVIDEGRTKFKAQLPEILEDAENELTPSIRTLIESIFKTIQEIEEKQKNIEKRLLLMSQESSDYKRLLEVPGVGELSASMFIASVGSACEFKNGRHVAAWMGLVPRQFSTGGKSTLLGITKSGDQHLRATLIHGARSLILAAIRKKKTDPSSKWIKDLYEKKGWNITAVAVANRNARIMTSLIKKQQEFKKAI